MLANGPSDGVFPRWWHEYIPRLRQFFAIAAAQAYPRMRHYTYPTYPHKRHHREQARRNPS
jgi:hypothetical protein